MRELTQAIRVKAVLLRSADPDAVEYVAQRLSELQDPVGTAAICLAIFDGDAPYCEHAVRHAMRGKSDWVKGTFKRRSERGLPVDMQSMIVARMLHLRRRVFCAVGGPCT